MNFTFVKTFYETDFMVYEFKTFTKKFSLWSFGIIEALKNKRLFRLTVNRYKL